MEIFPTDICIKVKATSSICSPLHSLDWEITIKTSLVESIKFESLYNFCLTFSPTVSASVTRW